MRTLQEAPLPAAELAADPAVADSAALKTAKPKSHAKTAKRTSAELPDTAVAEPVRSVELYMTPEFKPPHKVEGAEAATQPWKFDGSESMYPFWAVRRLPEALLQRENLRAKPGEELRFNCEVLEETITNITMGGGVATTTRMIALPCMTNSREVREGEELLLEVRAKPPTPKSKAITWKTVVAAEARAKDQPRKDKYVVAKAAAPPPQTAPTQVQPVAA